MFGAAEFADSGGFEGMAALAHVALGEEDSPDAEDVETATESQPAQPVQSASGPDRSASALAQAERDGERPTLDQLKPDRLAAARSICKTYANKATRLPARGCRTNSA